MNRDAERLAALLDDWLAGEAAEPASPELGELLAAARAVRTLEDVPPPPGGLNRGRAAFIGAGVRAAERRRAPGLATLLADAFGRYRLAPLALAVAVLMLGGVVTTARAQDSLPGDVLYPVKRLTESVQQAITRPEERESLRAELQRRRRDEAQRLLAERRAETVAFEGRVALLADGRLTVDGLVVDVSGIGLEGLGPGAVVYVEGHTGPDGTVHARHLRVVVPVAASPTPEAAPATATAVALVSLPPEPAGTATRRPVAPTAAPIRPTLAPTLAPTTLPTVATTPTSVAAAPGPRLRERQYLEWSGALESMGELTWRVDGVEFYRPAGRVEGTPTLCSRVSVKAERRRDRLELVVLRVISAAPPARNETSKGQVEAIEAQAWVVDGRRLLVTSESVIVGEPRVGAMVRLTLLVDPCGRQIVQRAEFEGEARPVEFLGHLQAFDETQWVVDGRAIRVLPGSTEVRGIPWVGAMVRVKALQGDGGVLTATLLVVLDTPPTATTEPTPEPTATGAPPGPTSTPSAVAPPPNETPPAPTAAVPVTP